MAVFFSSQDSKGGRANSPLFSPLRARRVRAVLNSTADMSLGIRVRPCNGRGHETTFMPLRETRSGSDSVS